jgi:hypothetical protein
MPRDSPFWNGRDRLLLLLPLQHNMYEGGMCAAASRSDLNPVNQHMNEARVQHI